MFACNSEICEPNIRIIIMEHNNRFSDSFFQQVGLTEESTDERVLKLFSIFLNRAFNDPAFGIVNLKLAL